MSKKDKETVAALGIDAEALGGIPTAGSLGLLQQSAFAREPLHFVEDIYYPTRMDYFAARALQGLLVGRSEKDRRACAKQAVILAQEIIERVDSAKD